MQGRFNWEFLLAALCVHLTLAFLLSLLPNPPQRDPPSRIEVEYVPREESADSNLPFVRLDDVPEEMLKKKILDKANFLSDRVSRVEKEMQARLNGITQNQKSPQVQPQKKESLPLPPQQRLEDFAFPSQEPWANSSQSALQSQVGHKLPDSVGYGVITALNADRFLYSSFFLRFEDVTRFRWEQNVYHAIERTPSAVFVRALDPRWRTEVEVQILPSGEIKKVVIFKNAGLKLFDEAVVKALKEARVIPNPPAGMIDKEENLIRLRFAFVVHTNPSAIASKF